MTVSAGEAKAGPYTGNDVTSSFAFAFKVFADDDIRVVETLIATEVESDLVLNTNYTVSRNADQDADPGGTVTYKVGGVTAALPSTKKLTIVGDFDYSQPTDIPNGGSFFASVIETALDRLMMQIKQIKEQVGRAVLVDVSSNTLPSALMASLAANVAASAASATAADASADAAAASALAADASADAAAASEAALAGAIGVTVQGYDADTAKLDVEQTWTAQQTPKNGALADGATIDWNGDSNGQSVKVTLGGNRTMNAPTNINEYAAYVLRVVQDGTGSRTLAWNSAFKFPGGTAPTLTTTASAVDVFTFIGGASNVLYCVGQAMDVK